MSLRLYLRPLCSISHLCHPVFFARYTIYPDSYINSVKMSDMSMRPSSSSPGRSYKWYTGTPVYPFGYGIGLTTFKMTNTSSFCGGSNAMTVSQRDGTMVFEITVTNTGTRTGDEVVFGFFTPPQSQVSKQLFGFQRVHLAAGASTTVVLNTTAASFAVAADNGDLVLSPGESYPFINMRLEQLVDTKVPLRDLSGDSHERSRRRGSVRSDIYGRIAGCCTVPGLSMVSSSINVVER